MSTRGRDRHEGDRVTDPRTRQLHGDRRAAGRDDAAPGLDVVGAGRDHDDERRREAEHDCGRKRLAGEPHPQTRCPDGCRRDLGRRSSRLGPSGRWCDVSRDPHARAVAERHEDEDAADLRDQDAPVGRRRERRERAHLGPRQQDAGDHERRDASERQGGEAGQRPAQGRLLSGLPGPDEEAHEATEPDDHGEQVHDVEATVIVGWVVAAVCPASGHVTARASVTVTAAARRPSRSRPVARGPKVRAATSSAMRATRRKARTEWTVSKVREWVSREPGSAQSALNGCPLA